MAPRAAVRDPLAQYNAKRNFRRTAEPRGTVAAAPGRRFVVQKHAATRLHYDFRLELDGVLLSWAITRGPSLDPAEKRLAVRTEDHPVSYADFEGTIPAGEYGGGTVMLWDHGTWLSQGDPHEGLRRGKLHFELRGERMRGEWILIRMGRQRRESWLLRKIADDESGGADRLTEEQLTSVETGRSMEEIAGGRAPSARRTKAAKRTRRTRAAGRPAPARKDSARPTFRPLQLATLVEAPPAGREWLHESKLDGYRCLLVKDGRRVVAYTRYGTDWSERFRPLVEAAAAIPAERAMIDGEVVALDQHGIADFARLQNAMRESVALDFYAFDLLHLEGEDLTALPLIERKARLEKLLAGLPQRSPIRFSAHTVGGGPQVFAAACRKGLEGIVCKRADAPYVGKRTDSWLKVKCTARQEFVIVGWTPSTRREGFASLILGLHEDGRLRFAGRVGTGFTGQRIAELARRLQALTVDRPAVEGVPARIAKSARWVRPELVAEIEFTGFTRDRIARHPSFVGLREDKPAAGIAAEVPRKTADLARGTVTRHGIAITHPERLQYPDAQLSKLDLVGYYERIAGHMLPHLRDRPLTFLRCPRGAGEKCFIQQHVAKGFPAAIHRVRLTATSGKRAEHFYIDDLPGILAAVQMGVLEFHGWGSRRSALQKADRLVFDLDPDLDLPFAAVTDAARLIRDRLTADGLASYPMLSGGKGIHVVAALEPTAWRTVSAYAKRLATTLAQAEPQRFIARNTKAGRAGRIFIDYLRNERGITAIMPYSTRAKPGAPVAMPLGWKALDDVDRAGAFDVRRVLAEGVPSAPAEMNRAQRLPGP